MRVKLFHYIHPGFLFPCLRAAPIPPDSRRPLPHPFFVRHGERPSAINDLVSCKSLFSRLQTSFYLFMLFAFLCFIYCWFFPSLLLLQASLNARNSFISSFSLCCSLLYRKNSFNSSPLMGIRLPTGVATAYFP